MCGGPLSIHTSISHVPWKLETKVVTDLRIYGFTDLPPSLPLLPADQFTRIPESNYRRHLVSLAPGPTLLELPNTAAKRANLLVEPHALRARCLQFTHNPHCSYSGDP